MNQKSSFREVPHLVSEAMTPNNYELHLGQDLSIGYTAHSATDIDLYFQETFTFRMLTAEASVALRSGE
ncbi:hypothetical protein E0H22_19540 [Rhodopseudomonas boonkerdii]|uniref:encapsulin n=1 Tax=Rhodopseudomonas boonkerdii TaxID=475937 RepID=UPI003221B7E1|nr:hypothetical protein E0H22_19540 [Rhodopseudomonas boonkerdii]